MPKNSVADWDTTASNNTDIGGISIDENCAMANLNNAIREVMAQIKSAGFPTGFTAASASGPASLDFYEDTDNGTNKVTLSAPSSLAADRTFTFPDLSGTPALVDAEDQTLTGGARVTSKDLGTPTAASTVTLDPGDRPLQHLTNNAAFTLAPGANGGSIILEIVNGASAGAVTTSGFTKVSGSFTTTSGHKFHCSVIVGNAYSSLTILALQ